jgi:hypothetical protein
MEGRPMLTRLEFARRLDAARREENRVAIVWAVCFFALLFAHVPLTMWVTRTESQWLASAGIVELAGFLAANIWLFIWYVRNRARRFGLLCPGCGAALHGVVGQMVAQWGNCPRCRTAVWMD